MYELYAEGRILLKDIVCDLNQDDPHSHDSFWSPIHDKYRKFSVISFQGCRNYKHLGGDKSKYLVSFPPIIIVMGLTNLPEFGESSSPHLPIRSNAPASLPIS